MRLGTSVCFDFWNIDLQKRLGDSVGSKLRNLYDPSEIRNKCKQYNYVGSQKKYGAIQFWTSPKGHLTKAELVEFDEKGSEVNRTSLYKYNAEAIPFVA